MSEPRSYINTPHFVYHKKWKQLSLAESTENTHEFIVWKSAERGQETHPRSCQKKKYFTMWGLIEVCLAEQTHTLHLTGRVIWRETDGALSGLLKTSKAPTLFCYQDEPLLYLKRKQDRKHIQPDLTLLFLSQSLSIFISGTWPRTV